MTNYNDGKWHGWNGGECPVHPKTVVEVIFADGIQQPKAAVSWSWSHYDGSRNIVAFRVIREHKEPREFWAVQRGEMHIGVWEDEDMARAISVESPDSKVIHVREVTE